MLTARAPRLIEEEIEPLTLEEAQRVMAVARQRRNGVRFAVAVALGLRQGEALGLKWQDVDFEAGTLTIRRALQRHTWRHGCGGTCHGKRGTDCPKRFGGGLAIVETKSRAGRRVIGVPKPLMEALKEHEARQDAEKEFAAELWLDEGWVFAQVTGRPTDPRADYSEWRRILGLAEVREARLHDARHTAATMLLVLKVPTRAVMDVMGWSQASMASRYQHVPKEVLRGIAEQVEGLLWKRDEDGPEGTD